MIATPRPLLSGRRAVRSRRLDTTASLTAQINAAQRAAEARLPAGLIARFSEPNPAWSRADDWLGIVTAERTVTG
ncbi:hypothetical protein [Mycobacterium sp. 1274756.6]|uniref:hypothetical protein n=1 Tax=Mycobacterium sp. 1274756.6 TaxID=1834076 RepID=UPI0012E72287|nr:hypothetical protein [Mycobacterium sp. 1274756.6]